ncbi:hypothetical protein FOTG_17276 [Fusarium oxysporum f. sp. vasinfectum 25433]|uniref:Uncharacterized protein n=1 Tax=Fusarium oxysporum f. sp. vasinfectum 25433 TaxID=1089449 RepID=X0KLD7_FUSOX|nr:hypothetical protein FOTG_17276 [Fusarium oxysporum f. sp. vasinfectum 25433]
MSNYTNQGCECEALSGLPSSLYDSNSRSAAHEAV